jgi:lysozyme family protein
MAIKGTAAYGIDQNANPGTDVTQMSPQHAQAMRYEYWRSIGGDQLAQHSPQLAMAAYDTAIMSGPPKAQQLLAASGGDPNKFMQLRNAYLTNLGQRPGFQGAAQGWANRNQALSNWTAPLHGVMAKPRGCPVEL